MTEKANNCPLFPGCSSDHRSARINHTATLFECSCWNWWIRWRVWYVTGRQWEAKTVLLTPLRNFFQVLILLSKSPSTIHCVCKRANGEKVSMAEPGDVLLHQDWRSKKVSLHMEEYSTIPFRGMQTFSSQQMSPVVLKKEGAPDPVATSHHWAKSLAAPAAGSS